MATALLDRRGHLAAEARDATHVAIRGVTKLFGADGQEVHAFGPVDLSIAAGAFISFLGPSGCGKSTSVARASIFLLTLLGLALFGAVTLAERLAIPWDIGQRRARHS